MPLIERLIHLRHAISKDTVLNPSEAEHANDRPDPGRLGEILLSLKAQAASTKAEGLDYSAVAQSEAYAAYRRYTLQLRAFDPMTLLGRGRQLAFWINLYNGLVLDAVVQWRVERSVREVPGFFWRAGYNIGGLRYSANDMENGVLRGNAAHPALPGAPFGRSDQRRSFSVRPIDPRVHFALVCASRSCPPVAVYDSERIDEQLDLAARSFIRGGGVKVDATRKRVYFSRIFQWYAVDFGAKRLAIGNKGALLQFVAAYLEPDEAEILRARDHWSVTFMSYDWSLNGLWALEGA